MNHLFYSQRATWDRLRLGPLGPHIENFAVHLSEQGYAADTGRWKLRLVAKFSTWLEKNQLSINDVDELQIAAFSRTLKEHVLLRGSIRPTLMQVLQHLRRCGILLSRVTAANPNPLEQIVLNYAKFLSDQRGLCQVTISTYSRIVQRFLENRYGTGKVCLQELSVGDISRFIVGYSSTAWPGDTRKTATVLRSFLGFLVQDGKITHNLAASVPAVASYRLTKLPMYLEPAQVEKLLSSCDRNSQIGRRDYAVLLLLARLGLRSGEIVHLNLENINWLAGEVLIRGKSVRDDRLPLLPEVGQALAEHLKKCRRVGSCRRVFLRMRAPYVGFSNSATIGNIFKRALTRARLEPTSKGPRLLRRSLATKMLKAGATLSQIGEVLRHQLAQTTEIYAKVDVTALRALAQPWPGGAR